MNGDARTVAPGPFWWRCWIPGPPVAKGRPRVYSLRSRAGEVVGHRGVTPERTARWEAGAAVMLRAAWSGGPLAGAVVVELDAVFARPKRLCRRVDPPGRLPMTGRPDIDNIVKAGLDALVRAGVVIDDAQVVTLTCRKRYTARDEGPGVDIAVREAP